MTALRARPVHLVALLALALMLRAFVPAGWMPQNDAAGSITVGICNAGGTITIPLDRKAPPAEPGHGGGDCTFAGFAGAAPLPDSPAPALLVRLAAQQGIAALAVLLLQRPAYLTPPGRGPPVRA